MNKQRGLSLVSLIMWGVGIALVAIVGMKVVPSYVEYRNILKSVKAVAGEVGEGATVADVRKAFERYAIVNGFESVKPADLEVTKNAGQLVINFSYEKRMPLVANVSLVIDYSGSSAN